MNIAEYHKMHRMEDRLWWFRGRRRIVLTQFRQAIDRSLFPQDKPFQIADIGCGTGRLLNELKQFGHVTGFDLSPVALQICIDRDDVQTNVARADAMQLPTVSNSFHALTALDILEHLPDDNKGLSEFYRALKPGGFAVFTVPAHPKLWAAHDVALHHQRRYLPNEFKQQLLDTGFDVERFSYSMSIAYPAAFLWRRLKSKAPHTGDTANVQTDDFLPPALINELLFGALCIESGWLGLGGKMPFGLSLLAVVRKPL